MIEALPILFLAAVAAASFGGAVRYATDTSRRSVRADLIRITAQRAWLLSQVQRAHREHWESEMLSRLEDQLAATEQELINTQKKSGAASSVDSALLTNRDLSQP